jgi:hypothetical protein
LEVTYDPALQNMGLFENQGLSAVKSLTLKPAGIFENTGITCEVYPNPSQGNFTLTMSSWPEKLQISVIDIKGQIIRMFEPGKQLNGSAFGINLTDLPKGVYFLKLNGDGLFEMKKIVIE